MKRTLATLLILTALLFAGCNKQVNSSSTEAPIALEDIVAPGRTIEEVKKHLGEPSSVVTKEDGRIEMTYKITHDLLAAARSEEVQEAYSGTVVFKDGVVESSKDMHSSEVKVTID